MRLWLSLFPQGRPALGEELQSARILERVVGGGSSCTSPQLFGDDVFVGRFVGGFFDVTFATPWRLSLLCGLAIATVLRSCGGGVDSASRRSTY